MTWSDVHYKKLTVAAWVECEWCEGVGEKDGEWTCDDCNGDGGKWIEGTTIIGVESREERRIEYTRVIITTSTILFQLYDPCEECGGKGEVPNHVPSKRWYKACESCLKDADGNPTGAAEGSGQGWKIEEVEK